MDAKIPPSFWNNDALAKPELRLAAVWLRTNAYINLVGYCEISLRRFTFETGLPSEALTDCFEALGSAVKFDGKAYWLRDFIAENIGRGRSLSRNLFCQGVRRALDSSRSPWLKAEVVAEYPEVFENSQEEALSRASSGIVSTGAEQSRAEQSRAEQSGMGVQGERRDATEPRPAKSERLPVTIESVREYAAKIGLPAAEADSFFDHFEANGWKQGGRTPLRSWQAALRNWQRRAPAFKKSSGEVAPAVVKVPEGAGKEFFTGGLQENIG